MRSAVLLSLAALFVAYAEVACPAPLGAVRGELSPAQMREDLVYLRDTFGARDKSFDTQDRVALNALVNDAIAHVDSLDMTHFGLLVARAVAISRNSHTAAQPLLLFHEMPLRLWWFADGLYVVKAHPDDAELIGARIDRIGDLTPEEALTRLTPYLSGHKNWVKVLSSVWLTFLEPLHAVGASQSDVEVAIAVRLANGTQKTVTLHAQPSVDPSPTRDLWGALIPDDKLLPGRWPHALDGAATPLAYQPPVDFAGEMIGGGKRVLYIRSNVIVPLGTETFDQRMAPVLQTLMKERPTNVVMDLRLNTGGNFYNTLLLTEGLPRLVPKTGHLYVLMDGVTHSAALVTAARLKYFGEGRTVFVGSPVSDPGDFWAEGGDMTLPNSHMAVSYAAQFEDWEKGCDDLDKCFWLSVAFGVKNVSFVPDILLEPTFRDYAAGRDPVLDAVLARIQ